MYHYRIIPLFPLLPLSPAAPSVPAILEGLKGPLGCLTQARYGIGWGTIGAAMAVYEASVNYSKERIQFDKPIGGYQMTQEKLAWMLTEITKGQLLALHIGKNKDDKTMRFQEISMLKRNNTWVARECAKLAREIHGANGISGEYPIMRHMMNLESVITYLTATMPVLERSFHPVDLVGT